MHSSSFAEPITELYTYSYDHAGRLRETKYRFNDSPEIVLSHKRYDEIGRLKTNTRHNHTDTELFEYNIRNWLTRIQSGEFEQRLYYNENRFNQMQSFFNGNISATTWTYGNNLNGYIYDYDGMNRLWASYAIRNGQSCDIRMAELFSYDKNGNVTHVTRNADHYILNSLEMFYTGNQLRKVTDHWNWASGLYNEKKYQDSADEDIEFAYDANGNMIKDLDRRIVTIQYNLLNLPTLIQFRNGNQIRNVYAADGRKLETEFLTAIMGITVPISETTELSTSTIRGRSGTLYAGNKEYTYIEHIWGWGSWTETNLHRVHNAEGYIDFHTSDYFDLLMPAARYNYFRRDHLGSVREVWRAPYTARYLFTSSWWEYVFYEGETVQRTQFFPSGTPWSEGMGASVQNRLFQGMEFIEMHGLDMYDFNWRLYCPFTMRTQVPDPLVEARPWESPYSFFGNNPVNRIDPTGLIWNGLNDGNPINQLIDGVRNAAVKAVQNVLTDATIAAVDFARGLVENIAQNTTSTPYMEFNISITAGASGALKAYGVGVDASRATEVASAGFEWDRTGLSGGTHFDGKNGITIDESTLGIGIPVIPGKVAVDGSVSARTNTHSSQGVVGATTTFSAGVGRPNVGGFGTELSFSATNSSQSATMRTGVFTSGQVGLGLRVNVSGSAGWKIQYRNGR